MKIRLTLMSDRMTTLDLSDHMFKKNLFYRKVKVKETTPANFPAKSYKTKIKRGTHNWSHELVTKSNTVIKHDSFFTHIAAKSEHNQITKSKTWVSPTIKHGYLQLWNAHQSQK